MDGLRATKNCADAKDADRQKLVPSARHSGRWGIIPLSSFAACHGTLGIRNSHKKTDQSFDWFAQSSWIRIEGILWNQCPFGWLFLGYVGHALVVFLW